MNSDISFVDVILPLPVPGMFTYQVSQEFSEKIGVGKRVVVQFGSRKIYTALVAAIHDRKPELHKPKPILEVLDDEPVVHPHHIQFWEWIADYYMCSLGEVMNAAMPQGLKLDSETNIALHPDWDGDDSKLDNVQFMIIKALSTKNSLSIGQIEKLTRRKTIHHLIKSLIEKNAVYAFEKLVEKYKPKTESYITLAAEYSDEDLLSKALDELERAPRQHQALMTFLQTGSTEIQKAELQTKAGVSATIIKQLIQKGIFEERKKEIGRLPQIKGNDDIKNYQLSDAQQTALKDIRSQSDNQHVVLLHGVTSSGKTMLYLELIKEAIANGKQALYLIPEIALTTQLVRRLRDVLGDALGVYHSKFSMNERVEIWNKLLRKEYKVVIGARSALFLPFSDLALIVVDEEHDNSYKQFDPAPRYQARDAAVYLARQTGAKIILGSGTPSIESYHNAQNRKYGYVTLSERYGGVQLPEIITVNVRDEMKKRRMKSIFSWQLLEEIRETLARKEQVILFQNRRGFAPYLSCDNCGWIPRCINCDVSLSYHKHLNTLKCHYCGYSTEVISTCLVCESNDIRIRGFGTEKVEEEIKIFFPDARVARLDLDAARSRHSQEEIIHDFEHGNLDILVGTQMVTKGLDFDKVTLVGILSADQLLGFPDFHANERGYQLMEQVSGRAGRRDHGGKIIIQAFDTQHPVIQFVLRHDFEGFCKHEMLFRRQFSYPPFSRLIHLTFKHKEKKTVTAAAQFFTSQLKARFAGILLGPVTPPVGMVKNLHIQEVLLKMPKGTALSENKKSLKQSVDMLKRHAEYKSVRVDIDVDP